MRDALDLAPHGEIKWNDHTLGQDSATERQIDVSVRWHEEDKPHLLIIDAKAARLGRHTPASGSS